MSAPYCPVRVLPILGVLGQIAACAGAGREASPHAASAPPAGHFNAEVMSGVARVRAATAGFSILDSAVAAGYERDVPTCYGDAHGAMGFHHMNRALLDARVEVERPEILLYERHADGRYTLNGVEYIVPYRIWPKDSVPPTVLGENLKRADDLNLWYLHLWAWRENAAGIFADMNPAVRCPAGR